MIDANTAGARRADGTEAVQRSLTWRCGALWETGASFGPSRRTTARYAFSSASAHGFLAVARESGEEEAIRALERRWLREAREPRSERAENHPKHRYTQCVARSVTVHTG